MTERHEQAEARYQRMFETAKDGMLICGVETESIIDVNPYFLEFLGLERDQVIGRRLGELEAFQTAKAATTMVAEAAADEVVRRDSMSPSRREWPPYPGRFSGQPIRAWLPAGCTD